VAEAFAFCQLLQLALTYGSAARSKHSLMRLRSALASSMDLKNWQYSCTPCTPNVLFTLPTCNTGDTTK
jgi:lipopolysaccharide biosynthesis regulator YciM